MNIAKMVLRLFPTGRKLLGILAAGESLRAEYDSYRSAESAGGTTLTEAEMRRLLGRAMDLWASARSLFR